MPPLAEHTSGQALSWNRKCQVMALTSGMAENGRPAGCLSIARVDLRRHSVTQGLMAVGHLNPHNPALVYGRKSPRKGPRIERPVVAV